MTQQSTLRRDSGGTAAQSFVELRVGLRSAVKYESTATRSVTSRHTDSDSNCNHQADKKCPGFT